VLERAVVDPRTVHPDTAEEPTMRPTSGARTLASGARTLASGARTLASLAATLALTGILATATATAAAAPDRVGGEYDPRIRPADFVGTIDNPYYPLVPGSRWVYENQTPDGLERIVVEVTDEQKRVLGVDTTVVHDTVTLDGVIIEDTFDWYAQDDDGNVWYFGEDTHEYENGVPVNSKGAWEAGVDGAKPGLIMQARPRVGDVYRQEFSEGVAEDKAKVLSVTASADVPFGTFEGDALKTKDWNPLERGTTEHKLYAPGVGTVLEVSVKGGGERVELVEHTTP
jgi:X-X-X-Leu-X-X-Gly heptad repeat protein